MTSVEIYFENLDLNKERLSNRYYIKRRTSVIVTIPHAEMTAVDIQKLVEAGINAVRFNIIRSTYGDKAMLMSRLEKAVENCCEKYGVNHWPIATCIGLKGCMVKTGFLEACASTIPIKENTEVMLIYDFKEVNKCNETKIFVDNPELVAEYPIGMEISLAENEIILVCEKVIDEKSILCKVKIGGNLPNIASVHGRGTAYVRPYLSKKDLETIKFALDNEIDLITLNYVRHPETLRQAKQYIGCKSQRPFLLAGLATQECLNNLDDIIKESDGIVLLREFLSFELERQHTNKMFKIQKHVSAKCLQAGKPFYISGDVLTTALTKGMVSDMELSDVSNALLDGVTGFVLKDCEDVDMVLQTVFLLNNICRSMECYTNEKSSFWRLGYEIKIPINAAEASMLACVAMANVTTANLIVMPTVSGKTAKALFWLRPSCIVITVSKKTRITRILHTYRCVVPLIYHGTPLDTWNLTVTDRVNFALRFAIKRGYIMKGNNYLILSRGSEFSCYCDTVKICKVK